MSSTWIIILIGMIGGNFLLNVAPVGFYVEAVVIINLLILALAAFAAAWYYTGGDLAALPQQLQSLGADSLPHSGAKLI